MLFDKGTAPAAKPKPSFGKGLAAGAILVAAAIAAWWFFVPKADRSAQEPSLPAESSLIAEATPAALMTREEKIDAALKKLGETPSAEAVKPDPGTNIVWLSKQRYEKRMANGAMVTVIVDNPDEPKPVPVFESGLNNFMTNFLVPGEDIPETPIEFTNEEIMQAIMEKIEINDDDDDTVRFKKESIALLREQLVDYIKDGKTAKDFIRDLQYRQQSEAAYVSEARDMIFDSLANDSPEHAKELYDALNRHMNEKGLPKVRLPRRILKQMGWEEQQ
ncbi:MAG: hypothetical protein J6W80_01290 [Kiritimatiellae bacterium]|nr:hypothetical protein [Kiritimatiellia bacterium]